MNEFVGPFDFSNLSIQQARESFSHEWRKVVPHSIVDLTTLYFKATDGTHLLFSHQLEMAGAGVSKDDCIRKLIVTINGFYGHHLVGGNFPNYIPIKKGLHGIKAKLVELGWSLNGSTPTPPTLEYYLTQRPEFKTNVIDKVNVEEIPFQIEIPIISS